MGSNLDHRESFPCWEVHTINILYVYLDQSSQVALVVENLPANAGHVEDRGSIPESTWRRASQSLDCLGNPMDRGTW